MQVLATRVEPGSAGYQRNRELFLREIALPREQLAELNRGGGEKYVARAPRTVSEVRVVAGQRVDPDEILIVVDADGEESA